MKTRVFAVAMAFASAVAFAQEFRGTISGLVTDAQAAAMPDVKIVATETETGSNSATVSDGAGKYTIPFLAPGQYRITADAAGFKRFVREKITVSMGDSPVLDIRMEVGDSSQSINVAEEAPLVETANGSVGQVISAQQVEELPLNGRTPLALAELALGVVAVPTGTAQGGALRPTANSSAAMISMGGAHSSSNELLLDGAPDNTWNGWVAYNPPQDAVREVRMQAFESGAAFGHSGGGTANHVTKSGTNRFHGSAYDFNVTSALTATPFFTNKAGLKKPTNNFNQYGLSAGGPIWAPKLFDGRDKVFWFFAWEGIKSASPSVTLVTVPTEAERRGDLSALLAAGNNYQIYDPLTGVQSGTQIARQPFPSNIIPAGRLNPIAQAYMKFYPAPNYPGRSDGAQNYATSGAGTQGFNTEFGRLDFNLSDRHKVFGNVRHSFSNVQNSEGYFNNIATGFSNVRTAWGMTLDDVYLLSPITVVNVRLNWTRFILNYGVPSEGFDPTSLGFPSYILANSNFPAMPAIVFGGNTFNPLNTRSTTAGNTPSDSFQVFGSLVRAWGSHTLKFGADLREYRMSDFSPGNSTGRYTFGTNWTNGPFSNSAAAPMGQEFAAFLLGLPTAGSYDVNTFASASQRYYGLYLQDDWRVTPTLSLNIGIRYERETPAVERHNRVTNGFDVSAASPIAAAAMAAYAKNPIPQVPVDQFNVRGGLTFASAANPDIYRMRSHIFSPRFGFAWAPKALGGKTAIRGGTGIFVYPVGIHGRQSLNQQGFSQTTEYEATTNNYLSPANSLSNPFPGGIRQPAGSSLGPATFMGQGITFFNPSVRNPYSIRWNLGVQRQLPGNMVLEAAYIGNHSVHLPIAGTQLNYVPQAYLSTSPTRDQATINLLGSSVRNPFAGLLPAGGSLNGGSVGLQQLLLAFPHFPNNGITMQYDNAGSSYYSSLNARLEKRFSGGLSLLTSFVWNSFIEKVTYLNAFDPAPEKRVSTDSRPLRFVEAMTYHLPVGDGKLIDLGSGWKSKLLGGWVLNGIYTWQLGAPLAWGNVIYYGGDLNFDGQEVDGPAFDVTRFNRVSNQQLASNVRTFPTLFNNLRADGINKLNASLNKRFAFAEGKYLQVRFEAFNATNHAKFAAPNLNPANTNFGLITAQTINPRQIQIGARLVW